MHGRKIKIGIGLVAAATAAIALFPANAQADYAPAPRDVVGVGSDTLQALGDFAADGSYVADPGYNSTGNKYKFISIDATADANTRLAYGPAAVTALARPTGARRPRPRLWPGHRRGIGTGNSGSPDTTADRSAVHAQPDRGAARRPEPGAAPQRLRRGLQAAQRRHHHARARRSATAARLRHRQLLAGVVGAQNEQQRQLRQHHRRH